MTRTTYLSVMHVPETVRLAGEWPDDTTPRTERPVRFYAGAIAGNPWHRDSGLIREA